MQKINRDITMGSREHTTNIGLGRYAPLTFVLLYAPSTPM